MYVSQLQEARFVNIFLSTQFSLKNILRIHVSIKILKHQIYNHYTLIDLFKDGYFLLSSVFLNWLMYEFLLIKSIIH